VTESARPRKSFIDPKSPPKVEPATLRRIASLVRPYRGYLLLILVTLVTSALINLLQPIFIKRLVDSALPERSLSLLLWLCAGMVAVPLVADSLDVVEKYLTSLLGERVMFDLRNALYRHLHKQPLAYFTSAKPGSALSSVLNDVQGIGSVVSDKAMDIVQNLTVCAATLVMLFALEWRLALVAVVFLPFFALPARKVGQTRKRIKRNAQEKMAEFVGMLSETLSVSGALLLKVFGTESAKDEGAGRSLLDEIAREGARRMLVAALETEVAAYLEAHRDERDGDGHALVVRNGKGRTRKVTVGAGTIPVSAPRVNDRRTDQDRERRRFTSRILPPYMRRSRRVAEVLPVLYLRGLSTGNFREALAALLGDDAAGLSATNIARLTNEWETEYRAFTQADCVMWTPA